MKCQSLFLISSVICWASVVSSQRVINTNSDPYRHTVILDSGGRFLLEWQVDWTERRVIFNTTVATQGYIGFGMVHRDGKLAGADMIVGGVRPSGATYFADRYGLGDFAPELDPTSQDWKLQMASENATHTFLSFSRPFDTCDPDYDLPITDDLSNLIWAIGEVDDERHYHFTQRGSFAVYLLDPDLTPDLPTFRNLEQSGVPMNMSRFPMQVQLALPPYDTMYWCNFFRVPTTTKRHIIGFETTFPTDTDRQHVHHLLVRRCKAPPGSDPVQMFDAATRTQGTECFLPSQTHELPTVHCQEAIHAWAIGGRSIFFSEQAGLPMSENGPEYFMVQTHYDNPNILNNTVNFTLDFFYTANLREYDVGMISLGELTPSATTIVIPPSSLNHQIQAHCPPECLQKFLPREGVTVFAAFLHTHSLANGVRITHFRRKHELPWIANSDNYMPNYQQFRLLIEDRKVLPGDQLGVRCTYRTSNRNGSTVVGGHSTRDEKCTGHLYYYSKSPTTPFPFCRSELNSEAYLTFLGIRNTTWDTSKRQVVITEPAKFAGMTVFEYVNAQNEWNLAKREEIQRLQLYEPQAAQCPMAPAGNSPVDIKGWKEEGEVIAWNPILRGVSPYEYPGQCDKNLSPWEQVQTSGSSTPRRLGRRNQGEKRRHRVDGSGRLTTGTTTAPPPPSTSSGFQWHANEELNTVLNNWNPWVTK